MMKPFEGNLTANDARYGEIQLRFKRKSKTAYEKKKSQCKALEIGSTVSDAVGNVAKGVSMIPAIGQAASVYTAPISILAYITSAGLNIASSALGCDSLPFDEIKNLINEKFNEIDRKLDKQAAALDHVSKLSSKILTQTEEIKFDMNEGFKLVLDTIQSQAIKSIVFSINNFIRYFDDEKKKLNGLSADNYIVKLQEPDSILFHLKNSRSPKGDSLRSALYKLMDRNNNYAIPKVFNDNKAYQALYALFYGTQAYISIMFFLLDEFSYLADHYYEIGNDEKYNKYFDLVVNTFKDFKFSLVGSSIEGTDVLIDDVIEILDTVKEKKFIRHVESELYQDIVNRTSILHKLRSDIKTMELPVIDDRPKNAIQISFSEAVSETPMGDWVDGAEVKYAVQYEFLGQFSKLSEWSDPFTVRGKANPTLRVPVDEKRRNRLIFRKFNNGKPQLVGIMKNTETSFRDINRDLYNAALRVDENIAMDEFKVLINIGADMNSAFEQGKTAIHAAASRGNEILADEFLMKNNTIDLDMRDKRGFTPLHIAAEAGQWKFVKLLISHEVDVNSKTEHGNLTALHLAARNGFAETVTSLLSSPNIDINQKSENGFTALHSAVSGGLQVMEILLKEENIDINTKSEEGLTPFHLAVMNGDTEVAESLVKYQADLNARDNNNMTAMHLAAIDGTLEMVTYLLSLKDKLDINSVTLEGNWTPLHFAIEFENKIVSSKMIENEDIDLNITTNANVTALHLASATGQENIVKMLLERGINLEEKTDEGYTALHLGAMREDPEIVRILVEKGANLEARTADNLTPLHLAARTGSTDSLIELIDKGADITSKTPDGSAALHLAVDNQMLTTIKVLLEKGADARAHDDNNYLPIHKAMLINDAEIVRMFIKHDPDLKDDAIENVQSSLQLIIDILMEDVYDYLLNNYDESQNIDDIFEHFLTDGKFDLAFIFNSSEDDKVMIKAIFTSMVSVLRNCLKTKHEESVEDIDTSADNVKSISSKECLNSSPRHLFPRNILTDKRNTGIDHSESWNGHDFIYSISNIKNTHRSTHSIEDGIHMKNFHSLTAESSNIPDTILLLDVIMRSFFQNKKNVKQELNASKLQIIDELENIEEKFQEFEKYLNSLAQEEISSDDAYKDLRRFVVDGNQQGTKMMCNFKKTFSELKPKEIDILTNAVVPRRIFSETYYEELSKYLDNVCE